MLLVLVSKDLSGQTFPGHSRLVVIMPTSEENIQENERGLSKVVSAN